MPRDKMFSCRMDPEVLDRLKWCCTTFICSEADLIEVLINLAFSSSMGTCFPEDDERQIFYNSLLIKIRSCLNPGLDYGGGWV